jgi:uncharacterized protein YfeS
MRYLVKEYDGNLIKDDETGAVVNINRDAYLTSVNRHNQAKLKRLESEEMKKDINSMKEDLTELKTLVKALLISTDSNGR